MLCFLDVEVNPKTGEILDFGAMNEKGNAFHNQNKKKFLKFIEDVNYFCGHNIINHDMFYINQTYKKRVINPMQCIDTLYLSTLLFPNRPYHHLVKDDKLLSTDENNPLNDVKNTMALFYDEKDAFLDLDSDMQKIYYLLLGEQEGFAAFFKYLSFSVSKENLTNLIFETYKGDICENVNITYFIEKYPIELAYVLALIKTTNLDSLFSTWIVKQFQAVEQIMLSLKGTPCDSGCSYCNNKLDPLVGLKKFFNYDAFRTFDNLPLQEYAVEAALQNKSLIAVFPTGGGKSITYQLPALMRGENTRSLTVVISPLQSLMKDQVDNLEDKNITRAATLNGLLSPIERSKVIERVKNGEISILYLAPESLRSVTVEKLILSRDIARFVIDEAHCFSTWGHDFRVDYLYIGDFINKIQEQKGNKKQIPVSCFTATAKPNVIQDIEDYFFAKLGIKMEKNISTSTRKNLTYKVLAVKDDEDRYQKLRELLDQNDVPTVIYAPLIKHVDKLYNRLKEDGYNACKFHGKMDKEEKIKQQDLFMNGKSQIMIATSAFGMGVDKKDIGMVIHYQISNSIENYIQEAGRAGRDFSIQAKCYVLYQEEDLNIHFSLLNKTKLNFSEIQQIWQSIKKISKTKTNIQKSAKEIARFAGWESDKTDIQTRVTSAIAALENAGYIKRKHNSPRVFADSIIVKSQIEATKMIEKSGLFQGNDLDLAKRISMSLVTSKYTKRGQYDEKASRVDEIADKLGISLKEAQRIITLLREAKVISDNKDLSCSLSKSDKNVKQTLNKIINVQNNLLDFLTEEKKYINIKELNEMLIEKGIKSDLNVINEILNYLEISKIIKRERAGKNHYYISLLLPKEKLQTLLADRNTIAVKIIDYLLEKKEKDSPDVINGGSRTIIMFSLHELKKMYNKSIGLLDTKASIKETEEALFFISKLNILDIDGGFLILYNPMNITRIEKDNRKRYVKADYKKLEQYYENKVQQIHIVAKYADKMLKNYEEALTFVKDYFTMDYQKFLNKYFVGKRKEISRPLSEQKFKQLFCNLSSEQLEVIKDKDSEKIVVAAGPGSGKTRLLVHKLASIVYTEDIRHEQLLMLTFSRAAVVEFKTRLLDLIGTSAHYIEIKTFHSFCFDLLGRVGNLETTSNVVKDAISAIIEKEVDPSRKSKMVIVIDEAQDLDENEYQLIKLLMENNEGVRMIAVGDDDQNIFEFRGSSNKYLKQLAVSCKFYELPTNYRSKANIVAFCNEFVMTIPRRIKKIPIQPKTNENGIIRVIEHSSDEIYLPLIKHIEASNLKGTVCVLTRTNDETNILAGMLNARNYQATLIQNDRDFIMYNVLEMRFFLKMLTKDENITIIGNSHWEKSKQEFINKFQSSANLQVCLEAIKSFEIIHGKIKYLSDFKEFLKQSVYSDFIVNAQIVVSTLHKAKGREFDHVFIMYTGNAPKTAEEKRLVYVGMTRAKKGLYIHYQSDFLHYLSIQGLKYYKDSNIYPYPDVLVFNLTHSDVNLGYFAYTQNNIKRIKTGYNLTLTEAFKCEYNNRKILQLSIRMREKLLYYLDKGYRVTRITVKHQLYWYNKEDLQEYMIVLPEITLIKDNKVEDINTV